MFVSKTSTVRQMRLYEFFFTLYQKNAVQQPTLDVLIVIQPIKISLTTRQ